MGPQNFQSGQPTMSVPFNFVDAKLRGRRRNLYEGDRLEAAARKRTVAELAETVFPDGPPDTLEALQKRLDQACVDDMARFLPYLDDSRASLLRALLRRYQVWNIKIALRLFDRESAREQADRFMLELPATLSLPRQRLLEASELDEFIRAIPDETLREAISPALEPYRETHRKAFLEMGLDRGWWQSVDAALHQLNRWDRGGCSPSIEAERLCLRLLTVLRAARTYEMGWDRLSTLLPPSTRATDEKDPLRDLYDNPDVRTVANFIPAESELSIDAEDAQNLPELEGALWTQVAQAANRQFYTVLAATGSLVAYWYLKGAERRRLVSTAEMIRREVPAEDRIERLRPLSYRRGGN